VTLTDLHVIVDLLVARLIWLAAVELVFKPVIFWKYDFFKAAFTDYLHKIKL
jgi:hypothetical protein